MASLMPPGKQQYFNPSNGRPLSGGLLYSYAAGTSALKATYADAAGTTPNANPITLDSTGSALIYWDGSYKVVLKDASGNTIWTVDNYNSDPLGIKQLFSSIGATLLGYVQTAAGAFSTTLSEWLSRRVDVWDFMSPAMRADALSGSPVLDHSPAWNAAITALNGAGRVTVPRKGSAVYLLKDTVHLGTANTVDSNVVIEIEPGTRVLATLADVNHVLFSIKNYPGHFNNQGIKNMHAYSTNGNGVCMKFNGQSYGSFENNYIENFNIGRWFSNEGTGNYNEFIRFTNTELHLCRTGTLMSKDGDVGGTDISMHGISDRNCTINVGSGQVGFQFIDVCWYNADFDLKFFSKSDSEAIIKMATNLPTDNKGVFGSGSVTCEGPAKLIGTGRFYFPTGFANFDVGVTDTLSSPNSWEQGFMCANYIKGISYGSSGLTVAEVAPKSSEYGSSGPIGSFVRVRKANVEALLANAYDAHATNPGNGFYTGYTGYQKNYDAGGTLGHFMSSDGTEFSSKAPTSTQCIFKHNSQWIMRFDGQSRPNTTEGFLIGSGGAAVYSGIGAPEGLVTASVGSTYQRRDGGASTTEYVKESGSGNTGWIGK